MPAAEALNPCGPRPRIARPSAREVHRFGRSHGFGLGLPWGQLPASAPSFSPSAYPGYLLEFDDSKASSVTLNSTKVSGWSSLVGLYSVTQGTAANQPPYGATAVNGKPTVECMTASNHTFLVSGPVPVGITNASYYFVVLMPALLGSYQNFFSFNGTPEFYTINGHPGVQYGAGFRDYTDLTLTAGTAAVFSYVSSTALARTTCALNGVRSSLTLAVAPATNATPLVIGAANSAGAGSAELYISHAIVYNQAHSTANEDAVVAGLQAKWGIS